MHGSEKYNDDKEQNVTDITFHEHDGRNIPKTMISKLYESFSMIASFIVNSPLEIQIATKMALWLTYNFSW